MEQRRFPAEWEPHDATWLALPHDRVEWGMYFDDALATIRHMITELTRDSDDDLVELLVPVDTSFDLQIPSTTIHPTHYGDIWLRDTGPIFIRHDGSLNASCFAFNGWGGKYVFDHDVDVAKTIAEFAGIAPKFYDLVLEGGSIDSNGFGTLLATHECLLNPNRNPGHNETSIENILATSLGIQHVIWIERGLKGDHTDGHVDNVARFVGRNRVVCTKARSGGEPNADLYSEINRILHSARTADGEALEIINLPSPGIIEGPDGLMAASYCNFLITNRSVLVPVFDVDSDVNALAIFATLFPERRITPIPAYSLLTGGGTVHCATLHQPAHSPPTLLSQQARAS